MRPPAGQLMLNAEMFKDPEHVAFQFLRLIPGMDFSNETAGRLFVVGLQFQHAVTAVQQGLRNPLPLQLPRPDQLRPFG